MVTHCEPPRQVYIKFHGEDFRVGKKSKCDVTVMTNHKH